MKLLDCTLRDGGYYTNWDFDKKVVYNYFEAFNKLPVDYLEIGYRSKPLQGYLGEFFYCPISVLDKIKSLSSKKISIMLNEKDVNPKEAVDLMEPCIGMVTMVRIAVNPENFLRALQLAKVIKKLGFEVGFNVMYMSTWAERKEFLKQIREVEGIIDYFYMVDSYGGVFPEDIIKSIDLVRSQTSTPIGFHGHNNLELGLINTLTAIENGVEIVDATITGMGRGAGNLKTELLLTVLNSQGKLDFDFNKLSEITDEFSNIQKAYQWGTNLPYMVSGANSLPQKQVMEWVSKRYFSFNSIIRALTNQSKGIDDNQKFPVLDFKKEKKYEAAMIVGGGPSILAHSNAISQFLEQHHDVVIIHASSKNAMEFYKANNDQYFCLVGNEGHRLEKVYGNSEKIKGKCILPPFPRKMGTYIPDTLQKSTFELSNINFTDTFQNSHTALALQTALELGVNKLFITGYDGYTGDSINEKEQELMKENDYLFKKVHENGIYCVSLTPTRYVEVEQESIYARL